MSRTCPPVIQSASGRNRWWLLMLAVGGLVGAVVLFLFNPAVSAFYPFCQFYKSTGLQCPGCGSLRAMHQLLHGEFTTAFRFNPLLISMLPLVGYMTITFGLATVRCRPWPKLLRPVHLWTMFGLLMIFTVWRNL